MIDPLGNEKMFGILQTAMDAASLRHQVLSANLANMDTPGYKSRDLEFEKILRDFDDRENMKPDARTDANRVLPPPQPLNFKDYIIEKTTGHLTERFDGNNVDLDEQIAKLATTRGRFQLASMFMTRKIRLLNEVITGR